MGRGGSAADGRRHRLSRPVYPLRAAGGRNVLVLGAGNGVSTFAVALAAAEGATVLVTSSAQDKIDRARALGAVGGVRYTGPDWVEGVRELTRGGGVDVVIDGAGANLQQSLQCLRPGGRLAVFGASAGTVAQIDVPGLYLSQRSILATSLGDATDFSGLLHNISNAAWHPAIDSVYQLEDVRFAHERIESRGHFGKIILNNHTRPATSTVPV